jgi:hypothetical protein
VCQLGQDLRIALPGGQRVEHLPPGDPEQLAGHRRQLDLGVFEQLLHPLLLRAAFDDQIGPIAGDIPQPTDLWWRYEAGADHAPLSDLAQPDRIQPVSLGPTGQVLDVAGVDQPRLEPGRLQQVEHRLPVVTEVFSPRSAVE